MVRPQLTPGRRAAVLGRPIRHSLSPVLHRAAYAHLGLDWTYEAIEVDEAGLAAFLDACDPSWAGLSLTMPLKRAVLPLLDHSTDLVRLTGAANTVVLGVEGRSGHNTDVEGIVQALRGIGAQPGPAAILGAGATAASALAALAMMGCPAVEVRARRPEAAAGLRELAATLGVELGIAGWDAADLPGRQQASVVVCTVPASGSQALVDRIPARPGWLLDVAYAPWPPPLVRAWRAAGGAAASGEEMLLHQAVGQVRLMTGRRPDPGPMRAALRAEIQRRLGAQDASTA